MRPPHPCPGSKSACSIAGGGIGGLAAAIALARRGIESEVLERSRFSEETGAGIQLGPNATRALAALGVLEAIGARAFKPDAIAIYDGLTGASSPPSRSARASRTAMALPI